MKIENVNTPSGVIYDTSLKRIYVKNIQTLTNDQICVLNAGDEIVKETGSQKHTYIVSYKEQGQGMCLTYTDATYVETVSYDLINGVWTYNSTDANEIGGGSAPTYTAGDGINISAQNVISNTKNYYMHFITATLLDGCSNQITIKLKILSSSNVAITTSTFGDLFGVSVNSDYECKGLIESILVDSDNSYNIGGYFNKSTGLDSYYFDSYLATTDYSISNLTLSSLSDIVSTAI